MKPRLAVAIAVAVERGLAPAWPQSRPMTFEDVLELRAVSDAQISPDDTWAPTSSRRRT